MKFKNKKNIIIREFKTKIYIFNLKKQKIYSLNKKDFKKLNLEDYASDLK